MSQSRGPDQATPFSKAFWIWPESHHWDLHNCYALFRKEFHLGTIPRQAPLFVTADQSYQLCLNGRYVCRGPARGFQEHWPYDVVDVRGYLKKGRNVLAVRAHNPGFSNFQYRSEGYAGLLIAAEWNGCRIYSDATWKSRRQTRVVKQTVPTSVQLFCQEHIDLRAENPEWMQPDFDDRSWSGKTAAFVWNSMPWFGLEERGIPLLDETIIFPESCLGEAAGRCAGDYLITRDVARTRYDEGLGHEGEKKDAAQIRLPAASVGRFRSVLIDFGRTVVGSLGLEISGPRGGEIIDTLHTETIDPQTGLPDFVPDTHSRTAFGHRLVCRRGTNSHFFYHPFGFRYLVLTARDHTVPLKIRVSLRTTLYPLAQKGVFRSSDSSLEKIWHACAWTQRCCSMDAFVDTPWREQAQWWGDARVQAKNTFFLAGDTRLFRRGIAQIAAQTAPNGLTYGHAPTMAHRCILPDFTLIWLLTLWDYYWQTGSLEPFLTHEETVRKALAYYESQIDRRNGLLSFDPRYWLFLDWAEVCKDGYPAIYNLWLLLAWQKIAKLYQAAKRPGEARDLQKRSRKLTQALVKLVRPDGLLRDGLGRDGKLVSRVSVHAQTLAIMTGFQPQHTRTRIEKILLPALARQEAKADDPSCYWDTYVFEVLGEAGYGWQVVEAIKRKWRAMAAYGTTWETFHSQPGVRSFSHAWSAHPLYHLMQTLGGIRSSSPGWDTVVFQPCFFGRKVETVFPTPHGEIRSEWKQSGGQIHGILSLPPDISAIAKLPDRAPKKVSGSFAWTVPASAL